MDRWKSRGGKNQRGEEQKREDERRERVRRKKMQVHEKVGKSRNTMFFRRCVAPEGRKIGSLKRRVRSHLARWEMKSCTPLWREAHFQVKMCKTQQGRSTFGSCEAHSKSKCTKHTILGALLEVRCRKVHAVVAGSTFPSQNGKNTTSCSDHFWRFRCGFASQALGILHLAKSEQNGRVCSISKNDGMRGTFEEDDFTGLAAEHETTKRDCNLHQDQFDICFFKFLACLQRCYYMLLYAFTFNTIDAIGSEEGVKGLVSQVTKLCWDCWNLCLGNLSVAKNSQCLLDQTWFNNK